jgi:nitroimidazol reductase NimA-like FMN-containing flavoprotein (pyridoxamine 5'-phosphate oxidase superfamily)
MPRLQQQQIEAFLARPLICRLGCIDDDGYPYVVPCIYHYEDGGFYLFARERSIWARHLQRDQRVSLCIDASNYDEEQWGTRVLVKGIAELVEGPRATGWPLRVDDRLATMGLRMQVRYTGSEQEALKAVEHYSLEPFWLFFVRPLTITSWWGDWADRYKHADRQY